MNPTERNQLLDDLIEQTISEADFLRLEAEMIVHPEVLGSGDARCCL